MDRKIDFEGEWSSEYDDTVGQIVPAYSLFNTLLEHLLEVLLEDSAKILVAGSGTGHEIINLATKHPNWSFVGFDPAEAMLDIAQRKIDGSLHQKSIKLVHGYIDDVEESDFDAVTSILVMHFLPDDGSKLEFLRSLGESLNENAPLILIDLVGETTSDGFRLLNEAWKKQQLAVRNDPEKVDEEFLARSKEVHFISEERTVDLLTEAGYSQVQRFFQTYLFYGYIAKRA